MARAPTRSAATTASVLQVRWASASCFCNFVHALLWLAVFTGKKWKTCKAFFKLVCGKCCHSPSRGPWGCLSVLWGKKQSHWSLPLGSLDQWHIPPEDVTPRKSTWLDPSCELYPGRFSGFVNASTAFPTIAGLLIAFYDDTNIRTKSVKKVSFFFLLFQRSTSDLPLLKLLMKKAVSLHWGNKAQRVFFSVLFLLWFKATVGSSGRWLTDE